MLMNLKKSRRAFLVEYSSGMILLFLLLLLWIKDIVLLPILRNMVVFLAVLFILTPEFMRMITRYKVTDEKIIIIHGVIKQAKKNVYFHPLAFVPDLNIHQSRVQRFLGVGTVYLKAGGGDNTFEIKDVSNPNKVLSLIEKLIDDNKDLKKNTKSD